MKQFIYLFAFITLLSCSKDDSGDDSITIEEGSIPNRVVVEEYADGWHTTYISRAGGPFSATTSLNGSNPNELDVANGDAVRVNVTHSFPFTLRMIAYYENGAADIMDHPVQFGAIITYHVQPYEAPGW